MTAEELRLVQGAIAILDGLGEDKPWKSVGVLAARLGAPSAYLRSLLLEYVAATPWDALAIRYSQYPSKRNLDLIWAHTSRVGHRRVPPLDKYDAEFRTYDAALEGKPCLFLSHSHAEFQRALYVRELLIALDLNAWLSEIDIPRSADIFHAIDTGMQACDALLVDITSRSLESVWVQKEFITAVRGRHEVYAMIDGTDGRLLSRLQQALDSRSGAPLSGSPVDGEFRGFLGDYIASGRPVFGFPFADAELLGRPLVPLREIAGLVAG